MFGQTGNPQFGFNASSQSSPFGQSAFGKTTATTTFGTATAPSVFGSNTSLFGSKTTSGPSSNVFGSTTNNPSFGANTVTQSFGGFSNPSSNVTLFGTSQNPNPNVFGNANAGQNFVQTSKPASFGFGQTSGAGLFGQPQQHPSQQSAVFGQASNAGATAVFGSSGFGGSNPNSTVSGTTVKFNPITGTDTMVKNGVTQTISTRHHCITCMKEYEFKSLEELRLEDYSVGRKGQTPPVFNATSQTSPFGSSPSNSINSNPGFNTMTTGFGNPYQSPNTGLFSKTTNGFGVPSTSASTFNFAQTTSSNVFNPQSKPFGTTSQPSLFPIGSSSQTTSSLFSHSNPQTSGFGNSFISGQSNQNIGLFNQNKPSFGISSGTSTSNFGFGQQTTTNGASFGSKNLGTAFGPVFGAPVNSTFQSGNTGFGTAQNNNQSVFNSSFKPLTQPTSFNFGNTSTASAGLGSSGTSLFPASSKSNLFGTVTSATFSNNNTFGSLPTVGSNNMGATAVSSNFLIAGAQMSNVHCSSGLVPVHQHILALVSAPFGDSPLLKNLLPMVGKSEQLLKYSNTTNKDINPLHHKIAGKLSSPQVRPKVFAIVPLSKKSLFDGLEDESPLLEAFQPRQSARRLVLRPRSSSGHEPVNLKTKDEHVHSVPCQNIHNYEERSSNESLDLSSTRKTSTSWLDLDVIDESSANTRTHSLTPEPCSSANHLGSTKVNETFDRESETHSVSLQRTENLDISPLNQLEIGNLSHVKDGLRETVPGCSVDAPSLSYAAESPPCVNLSRCGYYTIPPVDSLHRYELNKTCIVPHLTIGRQGYGNVHFSDSFDIYGLNLDEIVHFRHKEVVIYPDDAMKPPVGQGLNRRAQVTLDRVWPFDKTSHEPITDPHRLTEIDYEGKLRRVSAKNGTRFLEYRPETGSWVFKVDHFSKYGLSDSDEEDVRLNVDGKYQEVQSSFFEMNRCNGEGYRSGADLLHGLLMPTPKGVDVLPVGFDFPEAALKNLPKDIVPHGSSSVHARLMGTNSRTLQLMKASFSESERDCMDFESKSILMDDRGVLPIKDPAFIRRCVSNITSPITPQSFQDCNESLRDLHSKFGIDCRLKDENIDRSNRDHIKFAEPSCKPRIASPAIESMSIHHVFQRILPEPILIADAGIYMGRRFKPKWGPNSALMSFSDPRSSLDPKVPFNDTRRGESDMPYYILSQLQVGSLLSSGIEYPKSLMTRIEDHLNVQLTCSKIEVLDDQIIVSKQSDMPSSLALETHKMTSLKFSEVMSGELPSLYWRDVWELCTSLWGDLPNLQTNGSFEHESSIRRKEGLSRWLQMVTTRESQDRSPVGVQVDENIFHLLTAKKLDEVCELASEAGDYNLALLVSQIGGAQSMRELTKQQLHLWHNADMDDLFSSHRLKIFLLIAGVSSISENVFETSVFAGLDWEQVLALHVWYLTPPTASIADAIASYETSFLTLSERFHSIQPRPKYMKMRRYHSSLLGIEMTYDLRYHILKLFCAGNYRLEVALNPQTHTRNCFDYGLGWLLQQAFTDLGYNNFPDHTVSLMNTHFSNQLETHGLWHWAIFILLHLKDSHERKRAIMDLLIRHVQLDNSVCDRKREDFLREHLKIPSEWINRAKAFKSYSLKRFGEAAHFFVLAVDPSEAHKIVMERLVADAVMNGHLKYLNLLLNSISRQSRCGGVSGWLHQGQLVLDYVTLMMRLEEILVGNTPSVDDFTQLQSQLVSLSQKITVFPRNTTKLRVCQVEMAKRILHLTRSIIESQSPYEKDTDFLVHLISLLPLPDDYTQQELRPVLNIHVNKKD